MNLNPNDWKRFYLGRLFDIKKGKRLTAEDQEVGNNLYIGAIDSNNGVANHIGQEPIHEGNTISLSYNGSVGEAFYQAEPYWATDDVNALYSKYEGFNEFIGLFMVATIRQEKYRFSYGRKWTLENMNNTDICLPIRYNSDRSPYIDSTKFYSDEGYVPDWQFMENYIKSLHYKPLTTKNTNGRTLELKTKEWKRFYLGRLFDIKKGKRLTSEDQEEGNNLYIGAIDSNNGVANHIGQSPIHKGNTISLSYNGSVGEAFYQPDPYWATDDVNVLYSKYSGFNKYVGLFIATVIRQEKYRFSYGRKWTLENMVNTEICLPIRYNSNDLPYIDDTNKYSDEGYIPDWQFMEDYIKSLPYGDRI